MTEQELRELDAWIAEHVMGWRSGFDADGKEVWIRGPQDFIEKSEWVPADDAAAMAVLEKCIEREGSAVIYAGPDGGYIMCSDDIGDTHGHTLPTCICLFAKKLFGGAQ